MKKEKTPGVAAPEAEKERNEGTNPQSPSAPSGFINLSENSDNANSGTIPVPGLTQADVRSYFTRKRPVHADDLTPEDLRLLFNELADAVDDHDIEGRF